MIKNKLKLIVRKTIYILLKPKDYSYRNVVFSLLGGQLLRIIYYECVYYIKGWLFKPKLVLAPNSEKMLESYENSENAGCEMANNGIVTINDYFNENKYAELKAAFERIMDEVPFLQFVSGAQIKSVSIEQTSIELNNSNSDHHLIYEAFTKDQFLLNLVCRVRRSKVDVKPRVILQHFNVPLDGADHGDSVTVPHSDRLFHHAKLFFYFNEQGESEGAYTFSKRTHLYNNFWRIIHEIDLDIREGSSRFRRLFGLPAPTKNITHGQCEIRPFMKNKLGVDLKSINGPENTFVLSDNRGFHARGVMKPGTQRMQIRIQYQYLEQHWYGKLCLLLVSVFKKSLKRAYY